MWQVIGIAGVFGAIGLGYILEGGHFAVIFAALLPELLIIAGCGCATLLIANDSATLRGLAVNGKKIFTGPCWGRADYMDALCLMFLLLRVARQDGNLVLERHIENPAGSAIFARFPRLLAAPHLVVFVTDVFRSITLSFTDPFEVGEMMEHEIEQRHREDLRGAKALATMGDALPALGIVAAVLGVIKAMASISEPPEVLGQMIAGALVGTFLGVFLAYGLVGPMAGRVRGIVEEEKAMLTVIRAVIAAHLHGLAPQLAVEVGRKAIPTALQPGFDEVDELLRGAVR
ncbi:MAG: flagellar motor stator protein MotA, partial [Acetobacteraceae bacterium]